LTERSVINKMSPRTKTQFEQIRQSRKASIMEVATRLFATHGFDSTSISKIAIEAGVSKGLLYNYFKNKDALVREIALDGLNQIMMAVDLNMSEPLTREIFIDIIDRNFSHLKQHTDSWRLYIAVITQPHVMALVQKELYAAIGPFMTSVSNYFKKKGVKNPQAYGYFVGALLDGIGLDFLFDTENYPLEDVKQIIIDRII